MTEAERRRSPRFKLELPVRLSSASQTLQGTLRELCRDAALVRIGEALDLGQEVSLLLSLPGAGEPLQVGGRVVRVAPGPPGTLDVAVLFENLSQAAETRIAFFITLQGS